MSEIQNTEAEKARWKQQHLAASKQKALLRANRAMLASKEVDPNQNVDNDKEL